MDQHRWYLVFVVSLSAFLWAHTAAPLLAQDLPTATPDEAGVIYAIVQPNDTMWAIAARSGITLQQLLEYNGLRETDFIQPGQKLIIGYGAPVATPTADATPTPTATLPPPSPRAPSPTPPLTAVCLAAFQDSNSNGLPDIDETLQADVAFTVYTDEAVAANYVTDGVSEPVCIPLVPGRYQITRSIAPGERLTSSNNEAVILNQGDILYLSFGGLRESPTAVAPAPSVVPSVLETPSGNTAVVGADVSMSPTPTSIGGQPGSTVSLIPLVAVIIGGLLLTLAAIFFVRARV